MSTVLVLVLASCLSVDLTDWTVHEGDCPAAAQKPSAERLLLKRLPVEPALYAGVWEVTQGQWEKVMGYNPSFFPGASNPVECVSYDAARAFLKRLTDRTGVAFFLPEKADWQAACRAGGTGRPEPLDDYAWYWRNANGRTAPVGMRRPNGWGLYDTLGNVREWCEGDTRCGTRKWAMGGAWGLPAKKCTPDFDYFPDRTSDAPTSGFRVFSRGERVESPAKLTKRALWAKFMDPPADYVFTNEVKLVKTFDWPESDGELYLQKNGPDTWQRVLLAFPKGLKGRKVPGVVVPYYTPEGMIARDFETGADQKGQLCVAFMRMCAERGWASACGDTFQKTYLPNLGIKDFSRWTITAEKFNHDWPTWNCMGKKVFDLKLVTDLLAGDRRVNADRLAIIGHSLGGQSSYYCGMLDSRFKAVAASDFGIRFDQTFWESPWYWGDKLDEARRLGIDNLDLVRFGGGKPFCVMSGKTDDETSGEAVLATGVYASHPDDFLFLNHQTGHRPPPDIVRQALDFLARTLDK